MFAMCCWNGGARATCLAALDESPAHRGRCDLLLPVCACFYLCMHVCMYICVCVCIYIQYINTHRQTHMYMYVYIQKNQCFLVSESALPHQRVGVGERARSCARWPNPDPSRCSAPLCCRRVSAGHPVDVGSDCCHFEALVGVQAKSGSGFCLCCFYAARTRKMASQNVQRQTAVVVLGETAHAVPLHH